MGNSNKEVAREKLSKLIERYNKTLRGKDHKDISEETIRTWLNEFLAVFGWDVQNTAQVLQERVLSGHQVKKLQEISSTHKKPDYTLMNGTNIKSFLDAKSLDVNIFTSKETAFQIRSYGWSAQSPCAFVSNFEQLVIYDTCFMPSPEQSAAMGTKQYSIDEYITNFDILYEHLWRDNICTNHLEQIYKTKAIEGNNQLDSNFMLMLSDFRIKLAKRLVELNPNIIKNNSLLNYYVQVILDRIIFIRVCESKEIEKQEKLKHFLDAKNGFWDSFKNSCYMEFYNHYDGAMFKRDELFQSLNIDNDVFVEFVNGLYYPFPYRFDVIPVKVIANIYEEFLGKQLVINNGRIEEVTKSEYVKTNGAVCTPEYIVDMICKQTVDLSAVKTIEEIFNIKVLDPCCGSGVFVVSVYELLAKKMIAILRYDETERSKYNDYFYVQDENYMLTIDGRRAIVTNCIHGIDYDDAAIEVTKMSLALKIVDGNNPLAWSGIGAFGEKILREIDGNIKLGNTLVSTDNHIPAKFIVEIKPFDIKMAFADVFNKNKGFSYVIGNPPYVETKHFKAAQPLMHDYLSTKYSAFEGKADLSVLFIEKCISLLALNGKLGFIIQRRWFKTDYGRSIRTLINEGKYLEKLIDFKSTNIFKGRITYVSIMILSKKKNDSVQYFFMPFGLTSSGKAICKINDYLHFLQGNGIVAEVFTEYKSTVKNLMSLLVYKYSSQSKKVLHDQPFPFEGGDIIHFDEIDFYCFIDCFSDKEIRALFTKHHIETIGFENMDRVETSVNNLLDYYDYAVKHSKNNVDVLGLQTQIKNCVSLLQYINISQGLVDKVVKFILTHEFNGCIYHQRGLSILFRKKV